MKRTAVLIAALLAASAFMAGASEARTVGKTAEFLAEMFKQ